MERIGVLTGGGDCPGLNAVIRAVVIKAFQNRIKVIGIKNGWKGLVKVDTVDLGVNSVTDILSKGGTILGTSRTNPYKKPEDVKSVIDNYKALKLDALIAIGGEDTLGVANKLNKENKGVNVVCCPKTIDNDLSATDYTFGFDTAVNIATEAIDRLRTTTESHHRVMVVEVMGRHAGWLALHSGISSGANIILIPEQPVNLEEVASILKKRKAEGYEYSIVVAAEGAQIMAGANPVNIFGEPQPVRARIATLDAYSGHADRTELQRYVESLTGDIKKISVIHGEETQCLAFAETLRRLKPRAETAVPARGDVLEI